MIRIVTEMGLRIYRDLAPMRKEQLDLVNRVVWIPASKTPNSVEVLDEAAGAAEDKPPR